MGKQLRILSLGAGVQSSTLALMAEHGEIEPIDCAIFADTQAEPAAVYEWLDWLSSRVSFPVHVVTIGSLYDDSLITKVSKKTGVRCIATKIPAFTKNPDGSIGIFGRKCTADYKVRAIEKEVKRLLGLKRFNKKNPQMVDMLIGISVDEADREKPSRKAEIRNVFPLLDLYMTREDCLSWMKKHGYQEPPKSACIFCPFHSDAMWSELKKNEYEWRSIVHFERELQKGAINDDVTKGVPFLHRSCMPIDKVDFKPKDNRKMHQLNMFRNECEGLCGV